MSTADSTIGREDLRQFLTRGVSLMAVTRDERMVVEAVRCAAASLEEDGLLRVALPMPEGKRTLANLESTGVIALSAALPTSYATVQFKGSDARRVDWPQMEERAQQHREAFCRNIVSVGLPETAGMALWSGEYVAIAFTPSELYDQTPGPDAGRVLP